MDRNGLSYDPTLTRGCSASARPGIHERAATAQYQAVLSAYIRVGAYGAQN